MRINPAFSYRCAGLLGLIYGGALALLPVLEVSPALRAALALLLLSDGLRSFRYHVLYRHPRLPRELVLVHDYFLFCDGREATLAPHSLIHPWLVVLNLVLPDGRRASRVLFPDALDPGTFRRLRVRLRHPFSEEAVPLSRWARILDAARRILDKI